MLIETRPGGHGTVRATFRLQYGANLHQIHVVGEFNGWSTTATPMRRDGHGYVAEIVIPTGRMYRFRYLIDGDRWQNDWAADSYTANEYGGDDSVLDLTGPRASRPVTRLPVLGIVAD